MPGDYRYCPRCATSLQSLCAAEDSGEKIRLRCPACGWTHWNNPTPVLAAVVECVDRGGQVLLARNAAWSGRMFALITGFMEAGESPEEGIRHEVTEEAALQVDALKLIGVYDFQRINQVIIAYHAQARGEIRLSPELAEYRLFEPADLMCWPAGTGYALADWLRSRGHEPRFMELPRRPYNAHDTSRLPAMEAQKRNSTLVAYHCGRRLIAQAVSCRRWNGPAWPGSSLTGEIINTLRTMQ